jgi:type IV pilus assembly protein PilW
MKIQRGFTLIEMMTAMVIMVVVVAGITGVLIKQTQASESQTLQRDLEENGRLALLEIARNVRLAGYGITPLAAFDFDRYGCSTAGNVATCSCTITGGNPGAVPCGSGTSQRDRSDGPDELVLAYRDPSFSRTIATASSSQVTFAKGLTVSVPPGTIAELIGTAGSPISYVTVTAAAAVGSTSLSIATLPTGAASIGYFTPSVSPAAGFVGASLTLVTRVRYFVANDTDGVPTLWKERGKGNERLYRGIEDIQYTYDIGRPPTGSLFAGVTPPVTCAGVTGWTYGVCPAVVGQPLETAVAPDWQNDAYDSANRYTGHPVNIRNVNISIVARSTRAAPDKAGDAVPAIGNRPARPAVDAFKRTVLQMSEQPVNLLSRQLFQPIVVTGPTVNLVPGDASVGGG